MQNLTSDKKIVFKNCNYSEFLNIIGDLIINSNVKKMRNFNQHANISCYKHCMQVAFYTYLICKKLNLNYISATRGAMLHDLFLYDWHTHSRKVKNLNDFHVFLHPKIALKNANKLFDLDKIEQDVILKHMWPVTFNRPHYIETIIVSFADKYSACRETFLYFRNLLHTKTLYKYVYIFLSLMIF